MSDCPTDITGVFLRTDSDSQVGSSPFNKSSENSSLTRGSKTSSDRFGPYKTTLFQTPKGLYSNFLSRIMWFEPTFLRNLHCSSKSSDFARNPANLLDKIKVLASSSHPNGLSLISVISRDNSCCLITSGFFKSAYSVIVKDPSMYPSLSLMSFCSISFDSFLRSIIQRMLTDAQYRSWVVKQVKDPSIRSFWVNEFEKYDERFMREAVAPIQNKVGQLLMAAPFRNIFGQIRSGFNPRFMMDDRRILIASLAKGKLGQDKANLLGALLVTQFQLAAMGRANIPESERQVFYLYIDEFSNFTTDSFASILSEARKYKLSLVLSHQYSGQVDQQIHDAIYGNVGTHIAFRVSSKDAELLAQDFGEEFRPSHFTDLSNHEVYIKKLSDGEQIPAFKGEPFPPLSLPNNRRHKLTHLSRVKYGTNINKIAKRIKKYFKYTT